MTRRKKGEGLASLLWRFIEANPDEELTHDTICKKYDCTPKEAYQAVSDLVRRRNLPVECVHVIRHRSKGIASNPPATWLAERGDLQDEAAL